MRVDSANVMKIRDKDFRGYNLVLFEYTGNICTGFYCCWILKNKGRRPISLVSMDAVD